MRPDGCRGGVGDGARRRGGCRGPSWGTLASEGDAGLRVEDLVLDLVDGEGRVDGPVGDLAAGLPGADVPRQVRGL